MNAETLISGLERFFFDIIGQLIPGGVLLLGLFIVNPFSLLTDYSPDTSAHWWVILAVAYVLGSAITPIGSYIISPFFLSIIKLWTKTPYLNSTCPQIIKDSLLTNKEIEEKIQSFETYKSFKKCYAPNVTDLKQLRSIAMTVIDEGDKGTVIRFMFISLFCLGSATAVILSMILFLSVNLNRLTWDGSLIASLIFLSLMSFALLLREREFFNRALHLPFSMALAKKNDNLTEGHTHGRKIIYLAGGHRSGWQKEVEKSVPEYEYKDPSSNGLIEPAQYTAWDLAAIKDSDIIFAYFEKTNPSGYGLALEIGYASALGKLVIFVDEKSKTSEISRYLKMLHETSDVSFDNLEDGISYLKQL